MAQAEKKRNGKYVSRLVKRAVVTLPRNRESMSEEDLNDAYYAASAGEYLFQV